MVVRTGYIYRKNYKIQRFKCVECNRTFNELTGTPFERVHDIRTLVEVAYLKLRVGLKNYPISKLLGVPYPKVVRLSRRVMRNRSFFSNLLKVLQNVK